MRKGRILLGGRVWASEAEVAETLPQRLRGLLGRRMLQKGHAIVIERCGAVHTVGMRFAIDLVFLDRAWRVVRVVSGVYPGRLFVWGGWHARRVVECAAGGLALTDLAPGTALSWSERDVAAERRMSSRRDGGENGKGMAFLRVCAGCGGSGRRGPGGYAVGPCGA